jgi:hypothetical protein
MKRVFQIALLVLLPGGLSLSLKGQAEPEVPQLVPGLWGVFYDMAPEELNVPAGELTELPVIGPHEKPLFARAEATADIPFSPGAPEGLSLEDNFYIRWTGKIRIEREALYTFGVQSDDGARLFIDGKLVVDNSGAHLVKEELGRIQLKRGDHALRIEYFDATRDAILKVSWGAEGQGRQALATAVLFYEKEVAGENKMVPGLWAEYFDFRDGAFPQPPPERLPLLRRVQPLLNFGPSKEVFDGTEFQGHFFARWTGFIKVPADGIYTFFTQSDDGSRMFIDGRLVVNNNGLHPWQEAAGSVHLKSGLYPIVVEYFDITGECGLRVLWAGSWQANEIISNKQIIPATMLFHSKAQETN